MVHIKINIHTNFVYIKLITFNFTFCHIIK